MNRALQLCLRFSHHRLAVVRRLDRDGAGPRDSSLPTIEQQGRDRNANE